MKELKIQQKFLEYIKSGEKTFEIRKRDDLDGPTKLVVCDNDSGDYLNVNLNKYLRGAKRDIERVLYKIYNWGILSQKCWEDHKNFLKNYISEEYFVYTIEILKGDK